METRRDLTIDLFYEAVKLADGYLGALASVGSEADAAESRAAAQCLCDVACKLRDAVQTGDRRHRDLLEECDALQQRVHTRLRS